MKPGRSDYFALSALVVHEGYWYETIDAIASLRSQLAEKYGYDAGGELHAKDLIGRSGNSRGGLQRRQALFMLRDVLKFESEFKYARAINVVVDKRNKPEDFDVFSAAWKKLIDRFETTVLFKNFPSPWNVDLPNEKGFLIVDETDEEKLRGLVRKMRTSNILSSSPFGGGDSKLQAEVGRRRSDAQKVAIVRPHPAVRHQCLFYYAGFKAKQYDQEAQSAELVLPT